MARKCDREKYLAEISDITAESFSIEKCRDVFVMFKVGKINRGFLSKDDRKLYGSCYTHIGHIRWYCLKLLDAAKGLK